MRSNARSGPPPDTESRPNIQVAATATESRVTPATVNVATAIEEMRRLVADLDGQHRREAQEFRAGYELGFAAGRDVGYGQAETEMQRAWSRLAATVRGWANRPAFQEVEERRYPDRTGEDLRVMRGRDRFPLPDRQCFVCGGRISGGVA